MATQGSVVAMDVAAFSAQLLDYREVSPRARLVAQSVSDLLPGSAVVVYLIAGQDEAQVWAAQAIVGDVSVEDSAIPLQHGTLGTLAHKEQALVFSGKTLL
jgi:hypothetical protein